MPRDELRTGVAKVNESASAAIGTSAIQKWIRYEIFDTEKEARASHQAEYYRKNVTDDGGR